MNNSRNNNNLSNENLAGLREVNTSVLEEEVLRKGIGNRGSPEHTLSNNIRLPLKGPLLSNVKVTPGAPKKPFGTLTRIFSKNERRARKSRRANRKNRKANRKSRKANRS